MAAKDDPIPAHVEIIVAGYGLADYTVDGTANKPHVFKHPEPSLEERDAFSSRLMEWLTSVGHTCNPSCRPPFAHTSQAAHDVVEAWLANPNRQSNCADWDDDDDDQ